MKELSQPPALPHSMAWQPMALGGAQPRRVLWQRGCPGTAA